ncbi:unnamed protein product [Ilex paraguariensis]|uniref:Glutathione synthetase n=1 Tax=Ilex paraguariensis TaxID=185542 RepID=A0ABC8TYV9_9AQUA
MGVAYSSVFLSLPTSTFFAPTTLSPHKSVSNSIVLTPTTTLYQTHLQKPTYSTVTQSSSAVLATKCARVEEMEAQEEISIKPIYDPHSIDQELLQKLVYDALVWSSLHGFVVGDKNVERSGVVPGVGMVHAPFALLPMSFPENRFQQACELAPIFNELVDRVSLDGQFLQDSLSSTFNSKHLICCDDEGDLFRLSSMPC